MKKSAIISFYNTQGDRGAAGPRPAPAPTGPCARSAPSQRAASASKASARACRSRASASQPAPWRCAESPSALPEKAAAPVGLQQPPPVARAAAHGCGVVGVPAHALRRLLYGRLALALPLEPLVNFELPTYADTALDGGRGGGYASSALEWSGESGKVDLALQCTHSLYQLYARSYYSRLASRLVK